MRDLRTHSALPCPLGHVGKTNPTQPNIHLTGSAVQYYYRALFPFLSTGKFGERGSGPVKALFLDHWPGSQGCHVLIRTPSQIKYLISICIMWRCRHASRLIFLSLSHLSLLCCSLPLGDIQTPGVEEAMPAG